MDQDFESVIAYVPYARGSEQKRVLKDAQRSLRALEKKKGEAEKMAVSPVPLQEISEKADRELRTWRSYSGSTVKASLLKTSGSYAFLTKSDGKKLRVVINSLSSDDQQYIKMLKQQ